MGTDAVPVPNGHSGERRARAEGRIDFAQRSRRAPRAQRGLAVAGGEAFGSGTGHKLRTFVPFVIFVRTLIRPPAATATDVDPSNPKKF